MFRRHSNKSELISEINPYSPVAESFRALRTHIQYAQEKPQHVQVITVTSSIPKEGKTTIAVNLAITYARDQKRVLLIDADLHRPRIHHIFDSNPANGLSQILLKECQWGEAIRKTHIPNLHFIVAGTIPKHPAELLSSDHFDELLEELKQHYDIILFDVPPALVLTDAKLVSAKSDGVILVARAEKTKSHMILKTKIQLEQIKNNVLGVVLNQKRERNRLVLNGYY
ncbi:CpsD/CapB family tyrosine-protein kinase [Paenibacillus aquistagni]|uniref:CpsD/CapB family tyrosine-protein kinase n=1 Tax=Paenibacillus aquistagni TaxID=1852522 RepID=UPI001483C170|nr:CpsD/CapB family tyrosine-protein kinase [Paenibacillus aquistagni]